MSRSSRRATRVLIAGGAGALALLIGGASASSGQSRCFDVRGQYAEHAVSGPDCLSPVGLCIAGTYSGSVRGEFAGAATTITTTADTPVTTAAAFTSDSSISATVRGRHGTLTIKNAGVFATAGDGPIVDLQTIVGGTGDLAGASGALRAQGTFSFAAGGRSEYEGSVCLP